MQDRFVGRHICPTYIYIFIYLPADSKLAGQTKREDTRVYVKYEDCLNAAKLKLLGSALVSSENGYKLLIAVNRNQIQWKVSWLPSKQTRFVLHSKINPASEAFQECKYCCV